MDWFNHDIGKWPTIDSLSNVCSTADDRKIMPTICMVCGHEWYIILPEGFAINGGSLNRCEYCSEKK